MKIVTYGNIFRVEVYYCFYLLLILMSCYVLRTYGLNLIHQIHYENMYLPTWERQIYKFFKLRHNSKFIKYYRCVHYIIMEHILLYYNTIRMQIQI